MDKQVNNLCSRYEIFNYTLVLGAKLWKVEGKERRLVAFASRYLEDSEKRNA